VRRRTYTRTGDVLHVAAEERDGAGVLRVVRRYDTSRFQPQGLALPMAASVLALLSSCSASDETAIRDALKAALFGPRGGIQCLKDLGEDAGIAASLVTSYAKIKIVCDPSLSVTARYDLGTWFDPTARSITVNMARFSSETPRGQQQLLFHEVLHELGEHQFDMTGGLGASRAFPSELDATEACATMCFSVGALTKCECALCLRTSVCDPRCAKFMDCHRNAGRFLCPCKSGPNALKVFSSCSRCLAECPSGLACAGIHRCEILPDIDCPPSFIGSTCE
jgi:hypothetical protein